MKRIALLLTLHVLACGSQARAAELTTNFVAVRAEIAAQLTVASNTVPVNKKLIASLKKSLAVLDKPGVTNLVNDTKVLTLLTPLTKTSLSNTFNPLLNNSLNDYLALFFSAAANSSNNLAGTFPSGVHTAAGNKLIALYDQLLNADNLSDLIAASKQLAAAAKTLGVVNALVDKAENAPAPRAQYTATVTGALFGTFNFTPKPAAGFAALHSTVANNLIMNGLNASTSGSGLGTKLSVRELYIAIPNLTDGTTTYEVGTGQNSSGKVFVLYHSSRSGPGGIDGADAYTAVSGSLTVTVNKAAHTAFGTFSFAAPGQDNPAATASTSNGSFSVTWMQ